MSIGEKEIKKLWGLAAGRCSRPGCQQECITFANSETTVVGEMAHVIAKKPSGPRGIAAGGEDTYENLVLLCPTHHTEVDKAPDGTYPPDLLMHWKQTHEAAVATALKSPHFSSRATLCWHIERLLAENKSLWATYGPESAAAQNNPYSNSYKLWRLRKLSTIIPNNRKIINAIQNNAHLLDQSAYGLACKFVEHAEGFEQSSCEKLEDVPRFPSDFEGMIHGCSKTQ